MKSILLTAGIAIVVVAAFYVGKFFYLKPKNISGEMAPQLSGILPDGSNFNLSDLKGKYVLLSFWGSWCGPCRQSHPQLVDLYARYHGQSFRDTADFEIVSIGIERNKNNWKKAILADELSWPYHIMGSDYFDSPEAEAYTVKQIPTKFLIHPDGTILSVDPSFEQLDRILSERL